MHKSANGEKKHMIIPAQSWPQNESALVALCVAAAALLLALTATGILFVFLSDERLTSGPLIPFWVIGGSISVGCSALLALGCSIVGIASGVRSRYGWMAVAAIPVTALAVAGPVLVVGTVVGVWS